MYWATSGIDALWRHAWVVLPVAIGALAICRWLPSRPVTRHAMWVVVLAWFIAPLLLPQIPADRIVRLATSVPIIWAGNTRDSDQPNSDARRDSRNSDLLGSRASTTSVVAQVRGSDWGRVPTGVGKRPSVIALGDSPSITPWNKPSAAANRAVTTSDCPEVVSDCDQTATASPSTHESFSSAECNASRSANAEVPATSAWHTVRSKSGTPTTLPPAARSSGHSFVTAPAAPISSATAEPQIDQGGDAFFLTGVSQATSPEIQRWIAALRGVRDAVFRLPALPATIWLGGIVLILAWHAIGIGVFAAKLRRAYPAPAWIRREVRQVARRFGLAQVPETLVIDAQMSPLVLSGLQTRLILPSGLWGDLDRAGRRAILCHELAHMSRRDHWIRWAEILISTLCWWHPLVWWVRRRIHEEADLSCDAWVTWLMPRGRRAYAEALLRTNEYLSHNGGPMPSVGLGVTSAGAKRFTRRITMVMTDTKRPRCSSASLLLACGLGLTGWAVMPALSCPPADPPEAPAFTEVAPDAPITFDKPAPVMVYSGEKPSLYTQPTAPTAFGARGTYVLAPTPPTAAAPLASFVTPAAFPTGVPLATGSGLGAFLVRGDDDDDHADRLRKMEKQLAELSKQLSALSRDLGRGSGRAAREPRAPRRPQARTWLTPGDDGEIIVRSYHLPEGKLKALTELLVRDDVPTRVAPGSDAIEVHAIAADQAIFEAFVNMIHPDGAEGRGAARFDDASRALEFAAIARGRGQARGLRNSQDAASRAYLQAVVGSPLAQEQEMEAIERAAEAMDRQAVEMAEQADRMQEQAERADDRGQRRALQKQARELEREARSLERQAQALERKAEASERKIERGTRSSVGDDVRSLLSQINLDTSAANETLALLNQLPEANPVIASALRTAAEALRAEAGPEMREALEHAVAQVQQNAHPALRDALASYTYVDEDWLETLLARVADRLDTQVGEDTLEMVARMLEEHAARIEAQQAR